jgi:hypothetical protein
MKAKRIKLNAWQMVALEEAVRAYWEPQGQVSPTPGAKELVELVAAARVIRVEVAG